MTDRTMIDWCLSFPDQAADELERLSAALVASEVERDVANDHVAFLSDRLAASEAKVEALQQRLEEIVWEGDKPNAKPEGR